LWHFKTQNLNVENLLTKIREMILANLHKVAQNKKAAVKRKRREHLADAAGKML